jgi:hypothetical protein
VKYLVAAFAGGLIVFLLSDGGCSIIDRKQTSDTTFKIEILTEEILGSFRVDTPPADTKKIRYPVYIDTSKGVDTPQILAQVDTPAIIFDYLQERKYTRNFSDSNIEIEARLTVWQNRLHSFEMDYQYEEQTKKVTETITRQPYQLTLGMTAWANYIEPNARFTLPSGHSFGAGYQVLQENPVLFYGYTLNF